MKVETMELWKSVPGLCEEIPKITAYIPDEKINDCAVVILPGGGYRARAQHEGKGYAEFFNTHGITAFVVEYRVAPHRFPLPLLDARRGVKFVRYYAEKYGIDKNKIAIMGSSAGGHLAALTSTYFNDIEIEISDEIDKEDFIPNAQVLCYPVIKLLGKSVTHLGSGKNLLAENHVDMGEELSPDLIATEKTPPAFVWHTAQDGSVPVVNSLDYIKRLKSVNVSTELHIFPYGVHGLGLAPQNEHVAQWSNLLLNWFKLIEFTK